MSSCWGAVMPGSTPARMHRGNRSRQILDRHRAGRTNRAFDDQDRLRPVFAATDFRREKAMKIAATNLTDIFVLEPVVHGDERGFFFESFHQKRFEEAVGRKT